MSLVRLTVSAPLLALTLLAGFPANALDCDIPGDGITPPLPVDTCIDSADSATVWRWIGIHNGRCPTVGGWTQSELFGGIDNVVPPGLDPYCVYESISPVPSDTDIAKLGGLVCPPFNAPPDCLQRLDPDVLSTAVMAPPQTVEGIIWPSLFDHFMEQSGQSGVPAEGRREVRLAVVDTEPTGFNEDLNGPGTSDHGYSLLSMARNLLCGDPEAICDIDLTANLGLPLRLCSNNPSDSCNCEANPSGVCADHVRGGYVGTISQLAAATHSEVFAASGGRTRRLVINLSVAWEPRYGGTGDIDQANAAVQAMHAALRDASCRGAIVIAAAGNAISGPEPSLGPLLPAAWEALPAPDFQTCFDLLGDSPDELDFPNGGEYRPLVYAAGAVATDNDAVGARKDGEPRLVAFGDHAVAKTVFAGNSEPSAMLTGTSAAAIVVSAAAANAWHYRPDSAGYEIMNVLYESGRRLGRGAAFCEGNPGGGCGWEVARVDLCAAADFACGVLPGDHCPAFNCKAPGATLPYLDIEAVRANFVPDHVIDLSGLRNADGVPDCTAGYKLNWGSGPIPANPCPQEQFYGPQATPWTNGQPSHQACPPCTSAFASPGVLYMEIDDQFEEKLEDITLLCGDVAFRVPGTVNPAERYEISGIPEFCRDTGIRVSYRVAMGGEDASVITDVLIAQDSDGDGAQDAVDNCAGLANADQRDTDSDQIGNACDQDIAPASNDCTVEFADLNALKLAFFSSPGDPNWNADADFDGDNSVSFTDLNTMKLRFFARPGPGAPGNPCG